MFKFIHAADIHLDSPLVGLERYDGAPAEKMRQATRRALANLVQLSLDEQVKFVLIAGDLYDGDWRDYSTGLFFVNQMTRLHQANIRVFAIAGNHDAANKMTKTLRFQAHDAVTMLPADKPQTCLLDDLDVAIHGQGFATEAVTDDLSIGYPVAKSGFFNIGLLHTCASGSDAHKRYAPCTINGLLTKGYNYWALGHIHKRGILHPEPFIVFPGNVQGRHIGETGAKGCMLVTVHNNLNVEPEFRCLDVLRWERCRIDVTAAVDPDEVLTHTAEKLGQLRQESDGRPLAVRVEISGPCLAHERLHANPQRWIQEIRSLAIQIAPDEMWIEKVKFLTTTPNSHVPPPADGPVGELLAIIAELNADPSRLKRFDPEFAELARKLPHELKEGIEAIQLDDLAWLHAVLPQVQPLLLNLLLSRGTSQ